MFKEYQEVNYQEFRELTKDDPKLRNAFATAHGCADKTGNVLFKGTCSYPQRYKASEHMIEYAKMQRTKAAKETKEKHRYNLLFVGMGMEITKDLQELYQTDLNNYRFRTNLQSKEGKQFFIEFSSVTKRIPKGTQERYLSIDYVYDLEHDKKLERLYNINYHTNYNYKNVKTIVNSSQLPFTKESVLQVVNEYLNCNFNSIYIDNYDISGLNDEILCISPLKLTKTHKKALQHINNIAGYREKDVIQNLKKITTKQKDQTYHVLTFEGFNGSSFDYEVNSHRITG